MWVAPFLIGLSCFMYTISSWRNDDATGKMVAAFLGFICLAMIVMRVATPACYDGTLAGAELIRACH